jgi:hypothetical protein
VDFHGERGVPPNLLATSFSSSTGSSLLCTLLHREFTC